MGDRLRATRRRRALGEAVPDVRGQRAVPVRAAEALRLPDAYFTDLREELRAKRDLLGAGLTAAGFGVFRPSGTYFVTTGIRPLGHSDGIAFCRSLPERCGVVAVPNAVFYDHQAAGAPFVRFAFCKREDVLLDAVSRLKALAGG